ncbi:dihydroxyacetone kinase phosphoryl donor subunit DhaM [Naasia aerilata]|uniref:Phosphocarrier protein HPr n=1 Tax=Naasia aerilata TaxID=1162966 RepID=A0ABM8GG21_9MICO|nr:dihydroxyacetone kinase phosphoryl donor subunit DhaM [Naasia aerilata]BDZ47314.1 PTS sugar transporter subunit IIA [Naasia aerilata]
MASVGLVLVSHSAKIAEGLVELARQMAPTVALVAAGGTDEGGIGTSFDRVTAAIDEADHGDGVAIFCDLGSAILTAETALDFLEDPSRVRIVDAPLVEGAVAGAVAAEGGGSLDDVVAAGESARGAELQRAGAGSSPPGGASPSGSPVAAQSGPVTETATLVNREGLHARPAAEFVKLAGSFDAQVTVNGVDAKSLLGIMSLGLTAGDAVELSATGPQAAEAVGALGALVRSGFGES